MALFVKVFTISFLLIIASFRWRNSVLPKEANVWPKVCVLVLLPADVPPLFHGMIATGDQFAHLISDLRYVVFDAFDFTQYVVWSAPGLAIANNGVAS